MRRTISATRLGLIEVGVFPKPNFQEETMNVQRTSLRTMTLVLVLPLAWGGALPAKAQGSQSEKSLYARLGGYDAIAAVVDDFVGRLITDEKLARFFVGHSTDSKKRIRQHIVDQFCGAAGGPCIYTGRTMKNSHAGLGITEDEWNAAAKDFVATLDKFKVGEREKKELLDFVGSLKGDIVEKK